MFQDQLSRSRLRKFVRIHSCMLLSSLNAPHPPFPTRPHPIVNNNQPRHQQGFVPPPRAASPFSTSSNASGVAPPSRRVSSPPVSYGSGPPSFGSGPPTPAPASYGGTHPSGMQVSGPPTSTGPPSMSRAYSPPPPAASSQAAFPKVAGPPASQGAFAKVSGGLVAKRRALTRTVLA